MSRFIFVTGGVVSSLGKGISAASLATLLKARGYKVNIKKLDPYLNADPGKINPNQHGEVFVTEDGSETDLDLGHYERFTDQFTSIDSNITTGKLYCALLSTEQSGKYLGKTVQMVPHLVNLVKEFIKKDKDKFDFNICEIGGTVGDMEGTPFLEAIRQFSREIGIENTVFIHVTLLLYLKTSEELKTKPTQHSVKTLMSFGIEPDIILCRTEVPMSPQIRKKISLFCNVKEENVIEAPDLHTVYKAPITYAENQLDTQVLSLLNIKNKESGFKYISHWQKFIHKIENAVEEINFLVVGKYNANRDVYRSVIESIIHSCTQEDLKPNINIISADSLSEEKSQKMIKEAHAIIIPGGFGFSRINGKIDAITYARENKVPLLGICFGMQLAVIEFYRNVLNMTNANSTEIDELVKGTEDAVVDVIQDFKGKDNFDNSKIIVGKMNLGAKEVNIKSGTIASKIYGTKKISERHRHRYQIMGFKEKEVEEKGGLFSGYSKEFNLPEIFEIQNDKKYVNNHPFFIGVQYHPEFKSRPNKPHPLFIGLTKAAVDFKNK